MSTKCSTSPGLRLQVGNSLARRVLHAALSLGVAYSLYLLSLRGYPVLALSLLPLAGRCCWRLASEPMRGAVVCWQHGIWSIEQGCSSIAIVISRRSTCLPWLVYLAWTEIPGGRGRARRLWLFADSASSRELRCLRVRLNLER